jgi:four helix bundle protein
MFLQLSHTKLPIYAESQKLALECYRLTKQFPSDEKYAIVQQIRRAALSVHLNIGEGSSRKSNAERKRFYEISRGSVIEIDAALDIAFQLKYCDMEALKLLGELIVSCFKQLSGIIASSSKAA